MSRLYKILILVVLLSSVVLAHDLPASQDTKLTLFEKFIGVLVSSALIFSLIKGYLTVNKSGSVGRTKKSRTVSQS